MPIKNYTSNSANTFSNIQKILSTHKAQSIMFDYDNNGRIKGIGFALVIDNKLIGFKLPARVEAVEQVFYAAKKPKYNWQKADPLTDKEKDQAYRTAWANVKDWIDAQMAMIDTGMVKPEEVFLPYAVTKTGATYFEAIKNNNYLLSSSAEEGEVV